MFYPKMDETNGAEMKNQNQNRIWKQTLKKIEFESKHSNSLCFSIQEKLKPKSKSNEYPNTQNITYRTININSINNYI